MTKYNFNYIRRKYERDCLRNLNRDYKRKEPLRVQMIENGVVLPQKNTSGTEQSHVWMGLGGVLDEKGEFVELSGIAGFGENNGKLVFGGKYNCDATPDKSDETALYMGAFQPHWGHFLLEYCTRLWYYIKFKPDIRIAYCGFQCEPDSMSGNFLEFLGLLGIRKEQLIDIRKPIQFRKIIVPEQSFLRDKYITDEYKMMIDYAYQNIDKSNLPIYDKVYFTRTDFANAKEHGEKEIRDIFQANGYACLAPEKLSLKEQMFCIRNCKEFVVIPGGASMNGIFAAEHTKRIYLKKAYLPELPGDVFQIDQLTKADQATFIDCYFKPYKSFPTGYGEGPHFLGITKELKKFLKHNDMKLNQKRFYFFIWIQNWLWLTKRLLIKKLSRIRKMGK